MENAPRPDHPSLVPALRPAEFAVHGVPAQASDPAAVPDALGLAKALRRRWALALGLGLLLAATIGPATWYLVPSAKYTATATLRVSMNPPRIFFQPHDQRTDPRTYQKNQLAMLTNQYVLSHALNRPEVAALPTIREQVDAEEWLKGQLKVRFVGGSELLEVILSGDHPSDLAAIINAVITSYMEVIVEEERMERRKRLEMLAKLWDNYQVELKAKRQSLKDLAVSVGSHDQNGLMATHQFKLAQLNLAQGEQLRVQTELRRAKAEFDALRAEDRGEGPGPAAPEVPESAIEEQVELHPDVVRSRGNVQALARKYWEVDRIAAKSNDPALAATRRQWEYAQEGLVALREKVREEVRRGMAAGGRGQGAGGLAGDLARLTAQVQVLEGYEEVLAQDVERLRGEIGDLNRGGLDLEADRDEIEITEEVARKIRAEMEAVQVESDAPDRVLVLAEAKVPKTKDEMRKIKAGGTAALGSFVMALLGVSFWEFRARRVDTPDQVVSHLGLNLVGALPAMPAQVRRAGRPASLSDRRWQSLLIESVDATRTMLLHASRVQSVHNVMVTSAMMGEGKTSLACHLATSLARAGRKTLLIDCDLRRPTAHLLFDVPSKPGLCEVLQGATDLADVVFPIQDDSLDFIPAGSCSPAALQALAQGDFQPLLGRLKPHYDFIVVDSAPILPVADSLLVGQAVDAVIFSVMRDVSRLPQLDAARERLAGLGIKMLGVVVAGVRVDAYEASYDYADRSDDA